MSAIPRATPFRSSLLPRPLYACAGACFVIAGVGVAARSAVQPFAHGWWLASFLGLVGGTAQILLGAGQRAHHGAIRQATLWNTGTVLVPLGVLADVRLPVVVGSGALIAALMCLAVDLRAPDGRRVARCRAWYVTLLAFLAISVLVGTALAWDLAWT